MNREVHVPFCEGLPVKFRRSTHQFRKFTSWMCGDIKNAMFLAKANFLVAQGLFNYTEVIGSYMIGQYIKTKAGIPKTNKKGKPPETRCKVRFEKFFNFMGKEYEALISKKKLAVYDELRCGLTHEYIVKNKRFCVYNPEKIISHVDYEDYVGKRGKITPEKKHVSYHSYYNESLNFYSTRTTCPVYLRQSSKV